MNIPALAAEIATRVQAMAKDSPINNAELIERMIADEVADYDLALAKIRLLEAENDLLAAKLRKARGGR